jgi:hypothetical protein
VGARRAKKADPAGHTRAFEESKSMHFRIGFNVWVESDGRETEEVMSSDDLTCGFGSMDDVIAAIRKAMGGGPFLEDIEGILNDIREKGHRIGGFVERLEAADEECRRLRARKAKHAKA